MRLRLLFAVWLVYGSLAAGQGAAKVHVRFLTTPRKPSTSTSVANSAALLRQTLKKTSHTVTRKSASGNTE
jgi:hypothetical protein